jgi:hypothetical protein
MPKNKLGDGNGEAKLYFGSRDKMEQFFGEIGFTATCFVLRQDLQAYMQAIKAEYFTPSQNYRGRGEMRRLWSERMEKINALPSGIVDFTIREQSQIAGPRGYVNSLDKVYKLIREISLPLVSYISAMRLDYNGHPMFYLKLFADFEYLPEIISHFPANFDSSVTLFSLMSFCPAIYQLGFLGSGSVAITNPDLVKYLPPSYLTGYSSVTSKENSSLKASTAFVTCK